MTGHALATIQTAKVIGHRGAAALAPENTLAGLRAAKAAGCTWVEFDVMLTQDGYAVLHHDDTLDRTTNGTGPMADTTWAELRGLDAGSWMGPQFRGEPIPAFLDTIALLRALGLSANIEIKPTKGKDTETAKVLADLLKGAWTADMPSPLISSFSETALATMQEVMPEAERALLVWNLPDDWQVRMQRLGCKSLHMGDHNPDDAMRSVIDRGTPLRVYTVNDPDRAQQLFHFGVEAIFTDDPAVMLGAG